MNLEDTKTQGTRSRGVGKRGGGVRDPGSPSFKSEDETPRYVASKPSDRPDVLTKPTVAEHYLLQGHALSRGHWIYPLTVKIKPINFLSKTRQDKLRRRDQDPRGAGRRTRQAQGPQTARPRSVGRAFGVAASFRNLKGTQQTFSIYLLIYYSKSSPGPVWGSNS